MKGICASQFGCSSVSDGSSKFRGLQRCSVSPSVLLQYKLRTTAVQSVQVPYLLEPVEVAAIYWSVAFFECAIFYICQHQCYQGFT